VDVLKAIKRLKPLQSVRLDDIPGFNIKGCLAIFIPILRHILNFSLTQQYFSAAWKEAAVVPVFKRGNHTTMSNYRPISILKISLNCLNSLFMTMFCIMLNLIQISMASSELNLQ
jgi:hypothetical protein